METIKLSDVMCIAEKFLCEQALFDTAQGCPLEKKGERI